MSNVYVLVISCLLIIFGAVILYFAYNKKEKHNNVDSPYDISLDDKIRGFSLIIFGIIGILGFYK
jgi:hypothetical protein